MTLCVVITGANRGIGLALTQKYCDQGCRVFAICRKTSDALNNTEATIIENVDVGNADSLSTLAERLKGVSVDVLINNAGIFSHDNLRDLDFSEIERQLQINTLGPLRVTTALLENLPAGSKIGLITSRMGSISDNASGAYYGYRMSKAALNAAGKSLAVDLKQNNISVAILHPGFVQTDMVEHGGDISSDTAAERLICRLDELTMETSGSFWHSNGELLDW